ncbi:FAD/NAD(P)-binding protein [Leisingera aquaemixtae]|uniref:FAD/NAD(P)-binding protein n=1 Tax=Leisingera aquaemixtae TaxID=1396826 RepID=UPI0021A2F866|nr:FAD/NAD(P)-binding domain-containing protein [Leisingera aquaemixtae]UWQ24972.1 FAD/NAD(P)-binding protein [Leisingera aquaemixtae]
MGRDRRRVAIVGFGPRGLAALEALVRRASGAGAALAVDVFEPSSWPASGPSFSPGESESCLLNLPVRSIDLPPPPFAREGEGSFADWMGLTGGDGEAYLPRARLGAYLNARFETLLAQLPSHITVTRRAVRVTEARRGGEGWHLYAQGVAHGPFGHVLLSLGQPETASDDQLCRWQDHADRHSLPLRPAYPGKGLIDAAEDWAGRVVGIRGMALSALDVVRMLTLGLGGRFAGSSYIASGREPARIVPFSLDGHAPAPKPLDAKLDARFDPSQEESAAFEEALRAGLSEHPGSGLEPVRGVLESAALRVIRAGGGAVQSDEVREWLELESERPGSQEQRGTLDALRAGISQAEGREPPAVGYTIGQLWRKWQPLLRRVFDSASVSAATAQEFVSFDDGLKRYSYGAPVETARQLRILIETGLVDPRAADDPDITLTPQGWKLHSGGHTVTASVMIDAVLPQPALAPVTEPLVAGLRQDLALKPLGDRLGARCAPDAALIAADGVRVAGLALVGRLANGSAIATDSIHDCFGSIPDRWARSVLSALPDQGASPS